jgi:sugar/nucleoside kinase (ribokinase family)
MSIGINGKSLELYFIDGKPDGMLTAEVFNWTGHVLMTPRTRIPDALARSEAGYTGVYLLIGEKDGQPLAYVGESDNVRDRIKQHDSKKDWWETAVLITTSANNLNKAHVRYLEARLVAKAKEVGKVALDNGTAPVATGLTEAARANMEVFLDYLWMLLPALRVDMFLQHAKPKIVQFSGPVPTEGPIFELVAKKFSLLATASLIEGEFVVMEGSTARAKWVGKTGQSYSGLRSTLETSGIPENASGILHHVAAGLSGCR